MQPIVLCDFTMASGIFLIAGVCGKSPVVNLPIGTIQGTYGLSYNNNTYSAFIGIPYARPPVGILRFEVARPIRPWTGTWIANTSYFCTAIAQAPEPIGGISTGQEDCLYLSVYVPGNPKIFNNLDVIVHIHGGAWMFGGGQDYSGPKYLIDKNVIVININYRLGPFGFLSTADLAMPGNLGLKDQVEALRWIQKYIVYFGGNPRSVTITGMSAGGASVQYHYLSPLSKGLFAKGMSQSGSVLNPWVVQKTPLEHTRFLADQVGCNQDNTYLLVACLKTRSATQINEAVRKYRPWLFNPFSPLRPVVENYGDEPFISEHPYQILLKGNVQNLPWVSSIVNDEGLYPGADFRIKDTYLPDLEAHWHDYAPHILHYNDTVCPSERNEISDKIKQHYLHGEPVSKNNFQQLINMISDRLFISTCELSTKLHSIATKAPVYFYHFNYSGDVTPSSFFWTGLTTRFGIAHGEDVAEYILSNPKVPTIPRLSARDEHMKDKLINMWASFANTGVPMMDNVHWNQVSKEKGSSFSYLDIRSATDMAMKTVSELGERSFWESLPFQENANLFK